MTSPTSVNSPCINVCVIDTETGFCQGCYRTREEISDWLQFSHDEKVQVISDLSDRAAKE